MPEPAVLLNEIPGSYKVLEEIGIIPEECLGILKVLGFILTM
jgi:hypothetical protein